MKSADYKKVYGCLEWSFEVRGHSAVTILLPGLTHGDLERRNVPPSPPSEDFKATFPDLRY